MSLIAVLWGLLGFLAGFLSGTVWRGTKPVPAKTTPRKGTVVPPSKRRCWSREQWIGPVVLLLAILMGVQYMIEVDRDRDAAARDLKISGCQSQFNAAFAKQLTIRSELASQAQANVDQIILSIGAMVNPTDKTPTAGEQKARSAKYRKLFADFAKESDAIAAKRENTPLPKLPEEGCGPDEPGALPVQLAIEKALVQEFEARLDAQRSMILRTEVRPTESAAPVRTVVMREPAQPSRTMGPAPIEPNVKPPAVVIVNVPQPGLPPSTPPAAVPIADPMCTLNLLGVCVDL